jgi:hypothetical protein
MSSEKASIKFHKLNTAVAKLTLDLRTENEYGRNVLLS